MFYLFCYQLHLFTERLLCHSLVRSYRYAAFIVAYFFATKALRREAAPSLKSFESFQIKVQIYATVAVCDATTV
jgi:hypothetical protein